MNHTSLARGDRVAVYVPHEPRRVGVVEYVDGPTAVHVRIDRNSVYVVHPKACRRIRRRR